MTVRVWDIDNSDNYVLSTVQNQQKFSSSIKDSENNTETAIFTCISYCKRNKILCAGTNLGQIYFWYRNSDTNFAEKYVNNPESIWQLKSTNQINGTIKQLFWGNINVNTPLLSVNCITKVYILKEQNLNAAYSEKIWGAQYHACELLLNNDESSDGKIPDASGTIY